MQRQPMQYNIQTWIYKHACLSNNWQARAPPEILFAAQGALTQQYHHLGFWMVLLGSHIELCVL